MLELYLYQNGCTGAVPCFELPSILRFHNLAWLASLVLQAPHAMVGSDEGQRLTWRVAWVDGVIFGFSKCRYWDNKQSCGHTVILQGEMYSIEPPCFKK